MKRRPASAIVGVAFLFTACLASPVSPLGSGSPSASSATPESSVLSETSPTATAVATSTEPGWHQLAADVRQVGGREDHTWTLAPDGATAFLFGGRRGNGSALGDLWAYDLAAGSWQQVTAGPEPRFGHNAVWVDGIGLVIFGGESGAQFFNDVWAYNPALTSWQQLPSGGDRPVARYGSCAAVGPDGRLWISHGFTSEGQRFADTRAYDFTSNQWTDETPSGKAPIERCLHSCWWTADGRLDLYAGQTTGVTALGDLWQLSLGPRQATHEWTELSFGGERPPDRNLYASARWNGSTVIFGGQAVDGTYLADTWMISDSGVATLIDTGSGPPPRSGAELIADPSNGRLLLFGGKNESGTLSDLWELGL